MERDRETSFGWLFALALGVIVLWAGGAFVVYSILKDWNSRGTFGDMFGGVNALFSGLAFAGILFALHLQRQELVIQREELKAQREELKLTRAELNRTAEAQEKTSASIELQLSTMQATAKLSALSSLVELYELKIEQTPSTRKKSELIRARLNFIDDLENTFNELRGEKSE